MTVVAPRPYYIADFDGEADYVYSSRLIVAGETPIHVSHPGTPIQYLGAMLMRVTGSGVADTQTFLNASYFFILFSLIVSLGIFTRLVLNNVSYSLALIVIASIVVWPSFLTFMNYWGSEIFLIVIGLPTLGLVWVVMHQNREPTRSQIVYIGIGIGLGVAVKASSIPLALVLIASTTFTVVMAWAKNSKFAEYRELPKLVFTCLLKISPLFIAAAITFIVAIAPVANKMWSFIHEIYRRNNGPGAESANPIYSLFGDLIEQAPYYTTFVVISALAIIIGISLLAVRQRASEVDPSPHEEPNFNHAGAVFLLVLAVIAGVTVGLRGGVSTMNGSLADPGTILRQLTPIALLSPVALLYAAELIPANLQRQPFMRLNRIRGPLVGTVGVIAIIGAMVGYANWRSQTNSMKIHRLEVITQTVEELAPNGTRIAMFEMKEGGKPLFHFANDHSYSKDYFEDDLVAIFPRYTFLRFTSLVDSFSDRELVQVDLADLSDPILHTGLLRPVERMFELWRDWDPNTNWGTNNVISGGLDGPPVSAVAYSDHLFTTGITYTEAELDSVLEQAFGPITERRELKIEGVDWNFIAFTTE
jgi:hypothetical protein